MLSLNKAEACRILVIGDIVLDRYVYGDVARISPEAPVPVLRVRAQRVSPGCAANVAANIAALGASVTLVGVVGDDSEASQLGGVLHASGAPINLMLVTDRDRPTAVKTRFVAGGQQVVRADHEETRAIDPRIEDHVLATYDAALKTCQVVVVSDYNKGTLTDRVLQSVIARARDAARPLIVDPKRLRLADYHGATIIKPNRSELKAATGRSCESDTDAALAAEEVIAATGAMVLLTRSEQGMSLFRVGTDPVHQRTEAREVFDVSGAGDTVAATLAVALAAGLDIVEAMRLANAAAGIVVGKRGTATVSLAELSRALGASQRGFESRMMTLEAALEQRETWRREGLRCGFTNGCFDLIHPGHISLLRQAKFACDRLIVALNSDSSVRRLKGPTRPLQTEEARAFVMAAIGHVDLVTVFDEDTPLELIEALKPDVLIKGSDYSESRVVGAELVKSWGGQVVLADLAPEQSTTRLVARVVNTRQPNQDDVAPTNEGLIPNDETGS